VRPRLSARYRFSLGTLAGMRGNWRDAPIPDLPRPLPGTGGFDLKLPFAARKTSTARDPIPTVLVSVSFL
jgi:hypothetical protein